MELDCLHEISNLRTIQVLIVNALTPIHGSYRESRKSRFSISFVSCIRTSATPDFDFDYPHLTKLIKDSSYVCLS